MIDLMLDSDGDLLFTDQDLQLVDEVDEIKQELIIILKTRQGEFFGDETMGLNQTGLFVKQPNLNYIANNVVQALKQQERVVSAEVTDIELVNRNLKVAFDATLDTGQSIRTEVDLL